MNVTICDIVAICDGKCRDWWWVSWFVTEIVAICDNVKICIFMTYIDSICIDVLFILLIYTWIRGVYYNICPYLATTTVTWFLYKNYLSIQTMRKWLNTPGFILMLERYINTLLSVIGPFLGVHLAPHVWWLYSIFIPQSNNAEKDQNSTSHIMSKVNGSTLLCRENTFSVALDPFPGMVICQI